MSLTFHLQHQLTRLIGIMHRFQLNHVEPPQHLVAEWFDDGFVALPAQSLLEILSIFLIEERTELHNIGTRPILRVLRRRILPSGSGGRLGNPAFDSCLLQSFEIPGRSLG